MDYYKCIDKLKVMKNTMLLLLLFVVNCNLNSLGQNSIPIRNIIYNLQENEVLSYNEALLKTNSNGKNFVLIIKDTVKKHESFIYNGKKIIEIKDTGNNYLHLSQVNLCKINSFILEYSIGNKYFANFNGITFGPYEELNIMYCEEKDEYGIMYKLGSKYYLKATNEKFGPFSESHYSVLIADQNIIYNNLYRESHEEGALVTAVVSGKDYIEILDNKFISINGEIDNNTLKSTDHIACLYFFSKNNFGYLKLLNEKSEILPGWDIELKYNALVVNNKIISLFHEKDNYLDCVLTEKDLFIIKNNQVLKNNEIIHNNMHHILAYNSKVDFLFETKNHEVYYNNQLIHNDTNSVILSGIVSESENKLALLYSKNNEQFIKTQNSQLGPYENVENLKYDIYNNLTFSFNNDDKSFFYNSKLGISSDQCIKTDFYYINYDMTLKFRNHFFESSYKYDYIVVDGESFGSSPCIESWIDEANSCFKWTALENKEYVLYSLHIK